MYFSRFIEAMRAPNVKSFKTQGLAPQRGSDFSRIRELRKNHERRLSATAWVYIGRVGARPIGIRVTGTLSFQLCDFPDSASELLCLRNTSRMMSGQNSSKALAAMRPAKPSDVRKSASRVLASL